MVKNDAKTKFMFLVFLCYLKIVISDDVEKPIDARVKIDIFGRAHNRYFYSSTVLKFQASKYLSMSNLSKKFNNLKIVRDVRIDSTIWYDFEFRTDDIIIASYPKSGTTWMQQIIGQLIFNGRPGVNIAELSPWLEYRNPPKEENFLALSKQPHRRFIKTHLPAHSLYMPENIKYIYVVRDGRDVCLSLYNHHNRLKKSTLDILNDLTSAPDKPLRLPDNNFPDYFDSWIERNGYPYWSYWENIISWWKIRGNPNVRLVRYSDLLFNLEYSLIEIARFINIPGFNFEVRLRSIC